MTSSDATKAGSTTPGTPVAKKNVSAVSSSTANPMGSGAVKKPPAKRVAPNEGTAASSKPQPQPQDTPQ
ncbi:MAG: hypothetical protein ABSD39_04560 [Terriglobales bacterium]